MPNRLFRWGNFSTIVDNSIVSAFNGQVNVIIEGGGFFYVGGDFTSYNGTTVTRVAKISTSTHQLDSTFSTTTGFTGGLVASLVLNGSDLYCGGSFTAYKGTARQRVAKISASTAALDTTFDSATGFNAYVENILYANSAIYCCGDFTTYKGTNRGRVAKISASTAALDTTFNSSNGFDYVAHCLAIDSDGTNLFVSGWFESYASTGRIMLCKMSASTAAVDTTFNTSTSVPTDFANHIYWIVLDNSGGLYASGVFQSYKGTNRTNVMKVSASTAALDTTFDSATGFNSTVWTMALDGSDLYCGGAFATYKGTNRARVAKISASTAALDSTFDSATGFNNIVYTLLPSGSNLYCGGTFTTYKSATKSRFTAVSKTNAISSFSETG